MQREARAEVNKEAPLNLAADHGEDVRERLGRMRDGCMARLEAMLPGGLAVSKLVKACRASRLGLWAFGARACPPDREEDEAAGAEAEGEEEDGLKILPRVSASISEEVPAGGGEGQRSLLQILRTTL